MRLQDTGLTFEDIKSKVDTYMIETYERFDFLADHAKGVYMYDENDTPYLDFYAASPSTPSATAMKRSSRRCRTKPPP